MVPDEVLPTGPDGASHADVDGDRRFGGVARLYGRHALHRFRQASVCVIGIGGVGSWAAEALARSAIGRITLVDLDHVTDSNVNRQIHAGDDTLGMAKVRAMAQRIANINPQCHVTEIEEFIAADNLDAVIGANPCEFVIDAIDSVPPKAALIAFCRARGIPVVTVGAAGGRSDPTRVRVADLARTDHEPLLAKVRQRLRSRHDFERDPRVLFGVEAVYSDERIVRPGQVQTPGPEGADAVNDTTRLAGLNCAGYGSSVAVTAVFGFVAAGCVLRRLAVETSS